LIFEKGDKKEEYVIIITGDLVENAHNPNNYLEVKSGLDQLGKHGFNKILVVPGNHDYGTGVYADSKFKSQFQETFFGKTTGYPKVDFDMEEKIVFIGLDSMEEEMHWDDKFAAQGELGQSQLDRLGAILNEKQNNDKHKVIYLHHHPFDQLVGHRLKDKDKLKAIISGKIDAILYGHNHQGKVHNGRWGIKRCYDAGSATRKPPSKLFELAFDDYVKARTRVMRLNKDETSYDYVLELL
jgi:3',5'-cyclic AMP phosphodiesterase CpdA